MNLSIWIMKKNPYPKNQEALREHWRKLIKYSILSNLIIKQKEEQTKKEKDSKYIVKKEEELKKEASRSYRQSL